MWKRHSIMAVKRASDKPKSQRVFGQARKSAKMFRAGLYARVSTNDQQTIPLQIRALREYAARRGWTSYSLAGEGGRFRRSATATAGELAECGAPARDRRGAGLAIGPLGPVGDGPAGNSAGTGPP